MQNQSLYQEIKGRVKGNNPNPIDHGMMIRETQANKRQQT